MPYLLRKSVLLIAALFMVAVVSKDVFAEPLIKSKYFSVYADGGIDKVDLLKKLNAGYFLRLGAAFSEKAEHGEELDNMVASTLDAIYLEVSDILDIHMYDLNIDLEILPDRAALASILKPYIGGKTVDMPSFYYYDKNRIYISLADLNSGMLGHEIGHAIVTHYFVVPPPAKLQEVLSGYVEYSIRKHAKDTPSAKNN